MDEYREIKDEMRLVYLHDQRPWMIGYSGGKDSTLMCQLVFEMIEEFSRSELKEYFNQSKVNQYIQFH